MPRKWKLFYNFVLHFNYRCYSWSRGYYTACKESRYLPTYALLTFLAQDQSSQSIRNKKIPKLNFSNIAWDVSWIFINCLRFAVGAWEIHNFCTELKWYKIRKKSHHLLLTVKSRRDVKNTASQHSLLQSRLVTCQPSCRTPASMWYSLTLAWVT